MSNGLAITGRKLSTELDFYETPHHATEMVVDALLKDGLISLNDDIYEPCSGAGAIVDVLKAKGFTNLRGSDIQDEDYVFGDRGVSVFSLQDNLADVIFTNPPYNKMTRKKKDGGSMLNEFLRIANKKVILILNVFFLSSKERKELLESSHLRHMYIHPDRVTMFPYGEEKPKNGGTKMFVWLVWDKEYNGKPTFSWL
ncbi:MAG: hypothetical protein IJ341_02605 [Bacteroidales bacterium]|nr:hypothetical protein [Bacteroidales bacterium]